MLDEDPNILRDLFLQSIDWHGQGKIKPIQPIKTFPASQIQDAFRYMQQGVHMGKILIEMPQGSAHLALERDHSKVNFSAEKTYLLVGGLGGLGRTISTWMVENGARHLVYLSRSAGQSTGDQKFLEELKLQGCHPICVTGSVSESADVQRAVKTCIKPLAGVLQMSMNLNVSTGPNHLSKMS
jgi:Dehydrogenases with different specificities (related to short-chain alcohol dehydrogenases)